MTQTLWQPLRIGLLAVTFVGALAVVGKAVLSPKAEVASTPSSSLPNAVPLAGWQPATSQPLPPGDSLPPGQKFEYRRGTDVLSVEARIMPGDGNISRFLFVYTPIRGANSELSIKHQNDVGYYGVLSHNGRAYLSACVNPRGSSTVTEQQFMQSRYAFDVRPDRVLPWLLGRQPLLDQRCLWTLMSVPLNKTAETNPALTAKTFQSLESAWVNWYRWWQSNFPPV